MKNIFLSLLFVLGSFTMFAQKTIVIDVNYILENLDEYQEAQKQIDELTSAWRQEIAEEHDQIKVLYNKYQAEQVLMSDEMRKEKEDEIMAKEQAVMKLQKDKFGPEGELFVKRQELVQPIQEKAYGIIEEYAEERSYDMVFDSNGTIIYVNPDHDKTDEILRRLK